MWLHRTAWLCPTKVPPCKYNLVLQSGGAPDCGRTDCHGGSSVGTVPEHVLPLSRACGSAGVGYAWRRTCLSIVYICVLL
jgi:hypothetical protein